MSNKAEFTPSVIWRKLDDYERVIMTAINGITIAGHTAKRNAIRACVIIKYGRRCESVMLSNTLQKLRRLGLIKYEDKYRTWQLTERGKRALKTVNVK
jgi:hypothetical protein